MAIEKLDSLFNNEDIQVKLSGFHLKFAEFCLNSSNSITFLVRKIFLNILENELGLNSGTIKTMISLKLKTENILILSQIDHIKNLKEHNDMSYCSF